MAELNERRCRFVELYTSGPEGVRGVGVASYYSAGYTPRNEATARANAARLLANANVKYEIQRIHRKRDAEMIAKMDDWKKYAPRAQSRLLLLAAGYLPQPTEQGVVRKVIETPADRQLARVLHQINMDIIRLAYPPRVYETLENMEDPMDELARLIGVMRDEMPPIEDLMDQDDHLSIVD
jgi:hypothetical protein